MAGRESQGLLAQSAQSARWPKLRTTVKGHSKMSLKSQINAWKHEG